MTDASAIAGSVVNAMHAPRRERWFDPKLTLGNVLIILGMMSSLAIWWSNGRVDDADIRARVRALEASNIELKTAVAKIIDTQQQVALNEYKINLALEHLLKKP